MCNAPLKLQSLLLSAKYPISSDQLLDMFLPSLVGLYLLFSFDKVSDTDNKNILDLSVTKKIGKTQSLILINIALWCIMRKVIDKRHQLNLEKLSLTF